MKTKVFYFILGAIIFSTITAVAVTSINANQVTYTDSSNNEITVESALDNLYTTQTQIIDSFSVSDSFILGGGKNFAVRLSVIDDNFRYFNITSGGKGSNATCGIYTANVATKISNLSYNTDYSTSSEGISDYRVYFTATNDWCAFNINYHN